MMETLPTLWSDLAPALAAALLNSLWQCTLLAAAAAIALRALRRHSAAWRHAIGMAFLLAMAIVPAWGFVQDWLQPAAAANPGLVPTMIALGRDITPGLPVLHANAWAAGLAALWALGAGAMLLRHVGGLWWVARLERRSVHAIPSEWQHRVDALRRALRISREVAVHVADDVRVPFTARWLKPVIWMPAALVMRLPRDQVEALLAHELAHVRRLDWVWNGIQCGIESLLFHHPGVWWLSRRVREDREHDCDALAASACADAIPLAEALVELARARRASPRWVLAADGGPLMRRITRLLSGTPAQGRWWAPLGCLALLSTSAVLAAQLEPARAPGPTPRIDSSAHDLWQAGDPRTFSAIDLDERREYRRGLDAQGRVVESYRVDGVERPIDARARAWIDDMTRASARQAAQAERDAGQSRQNADEARRDALLAAAHAGLAARNADLARQASAQAAQDAELAARHARAHPRSAPASVP